MPMTPADLADIKPKLEAAKTKPVNFAACIGATPQTTVILFSKNKEPQSMVAAAKKAGDSNKTTFGTVSVVEGVVTLHCLDDVPSGICKKIRGLLATQKLTMKVEARDKDGQPADTGGDDAPKPVPPPGAAQVRTDPETVPAAPPETAPAAERDDDAEGWAKIVATIGPRVLAYVKGGADKAAQVGAAWKGALAAAQAGRHDDAKAVVSKIMPLLRQVAQSDEKAAEAPPAAPIPPPTPSAPPPNQPVPAKSDDASADIAKAARLWREALKAMEIEITKLQTAIVTRLSPDPDLVEIATASPQLADRLAVFDLDLALTLDSAATAAPDDRDDLMDEATDHLRRYADALEDDFFRDVDEGNGFTKVAVAAIARRSIAAVGKLLA